MSLEKKINLRPSEDVLKVVRKHGVVYLWQYLLGFGLMIVTAFFIFWLIGKGWWGYLLLVMGMLLGVLMIVRAWFFSYYNITVVTTERLVDISRAGLFREVLSPIGYLDIQDVFVEKRGVWAGMFNFGNIIVKTKNDQVVILIEKAPTPHLLVDMVLTARETYRQNRRVANKEVIYKNFVKILPELSEAELCEIQDLIETQLASLDAGTDNSDVL